MKQLQQATNLYAVYGTLRRGFGNYNHYLNNSACEYLGSERTKPEFTMVSLGGFPGVIPGGEETVMIEVFRVNDPSIERGLDRLEGYPSFYGKTIIETQWGPANMYILDKTYSDYKKVPDGDWREFVQSRRTVNER